MADLTEAQLKALDWRSDLVVTAGAGSGKTRVLVERFIRILVEDPSVSPSNILALTFTEKAASEMRAKVKKALAAEVKRDPSRFEHMLDDLDRCDISTIHSFCARIVRSEPLALGLDPSFEVMSEAKASSVLQEALGRLFTRSGKESLSLRRLIVDHGAPGTRRMLTQMMQDRSRTGSDLESGEFRAYSIDALRRETERMIDEARKALPSAYKALDDLGALVMPGSGERSEALVGALAAMKAEVDRCDIDDRDLKALRSLGRMLPDLLDSKGGKKSVLRFGGRDTWKGSIDTMRRSVAVIFDLAFDHRSILRFMGPGDLDLRAERSLEDLLTVYGALDQRFRSMKTSVSGLDFDDLIKNAGDLLRKDVNGIRTRAREKYRHILVDEFQDTDVRQWEIVRLLWGGDGRTKLFIVGDPKQSIYGFRSSDVRLFSRASEYLRGCGSGRSVVLDRNFRSRKEIMDLCNSIFPEIMEGGGKRWGVDFDPLEPHKGRGGTVTFVGVEGRADEDRREALAVARIVKRAVREGWPVLDPDTGMERPLRIDDVAFLFRGRTGLKQYESAFRDEGLRYVVYKGKGFYDRQEVVDMLRLIEFLCSERNDVALASVLKGPIFRLSDEDLFRISTRKGDTLMEKACQDDEMPWIGPILKGILDISRSYPAHVALQRIVSALDMHAAMDGPRMSRNIERLVESSVEERGGTLFTIRDELTRMMEHGSRMGEPPLTTEGCAVMMTVHAAKGLEWPLVAVMGLHHEMTSGSKLQARVDPDDGASIKVLDPSNGSWVETPSYVAARESVEELEEEEAKRLLYVAMTRARDHLVLSGRVPTPSDNDPRARGMMSLLSGPMGIDAARLKEPVIGIGGVDVNMVRVGPVVDLEEPETVQEASTGDAPDLSRVGPIVVGDAPSAARPHDTGHEKVPDRAVRAVEGDDGPLRDIFGTMVHEVLSGRSARAVALEHGYPEVRDRIERTADQLERQLDLSGVEVFNEVPLAATSDPEARVRRVDRLVRMADGSYIVVDFKTGTREPEHVEQVKNYVRMVAEVTGKKVRGMLIYPDDVIGDIPG